MVIETRSRYTADAHGLPARLSELRMRRAVARAVVQHSRSSGRRDAVSLATRNSGSIARPAVWRLLGAFPLGLFRFAVGGDDQRGRPGWLARRFANQQLAARGWHPAGRPTQHIASAHNTHQTILRIDHR